MAFDAFLKIEMTGIKSEQVEIQLESFNFGVSNSGSIGSGSGAGAGKPSFQDFSFAAAVSQESPKLFEAAANGQHIPTATLTVTDKVQVMMVTFTDVLISSYKLDEGSLFSHKFAEGDLPAVQLGAPMESVSFNFGELKFQIGSVVGTGIAGGKF
ncbi:MAG TPA: type VI secretion system tube protein Hcp [Verrucomicrobiae bacterium]|jgi:type VI protein secretion system component Hcp|nr:type VI secretion system tube protein Hcp [Verrucomicrobiae bacterium]